MSTMTEVDGWARNGGYRIVKRELAPIEFRGRDGWCVTPAGLPCEIYVVEGDAPAMAAAVAEALR